MLSFRWSGHRAPWRSSTSSFFSDGCGRASRSDRSRVGAPGFLRFLEAFWFRCVLWGAVGECHVLPSSCTLAGNGTTRPSNGFLGGAAGLDLGLDMV